MIHYRGNIGQSRGTPPTYHTNQLSQGYKIPFWIIYHRKKDMGKILQETPPVLKSLYAIQEKRYRFYGEEDEEVEATDGENIQICVV